MFLGASSGATSFSNALMCAIAFIKAVLISAIDSVLVNSFTGFFVGLFPVAGRITCRPSNPGTYRSYGFGRRYRGISGAITTKDRVAPVLCGLAQR